jgi:hypothetical protein
MVRYPKTTMAIAYVFSSSTRREDAALITTALLDLANTTIHGLAGGAELLEYVVHGGAELLEHVVQGAKETFGTTMSGYMMLTIIGLAISLEMDRRKNRKTLKRKPDSTDKKSNKIIKL